MIDRKEIFAEIPGVSPSSAGQYVHWVETDEPYTVEKSDRVIVQTEEVDIYTGQVAEEPDFYCWIVNPDKKLTGLWVEDGEFKSYTSEDEVEVTPEWAVIQAGKKPSMEAPFLTKDAFDQAFVTISNQTLGPSTIYMSPTQYNHTHSITNSTMPSHTHTWTQVGTSNSTTTATTAYVDNTVTIPPGQKIVVNKNVPAGQAYIVDTTAANAVMSSPTITINQPGIYQMTGGLTFNDTSSTALTQIGIYSS